MTFEVIAEKFTANSMTRRSGGPPSNQALEVIPKGTLIEKDESANPDHVEFTIGSERRYWVFRTNWNETNVRRIDPSSDKMTELHR
jgi:hypothetical protein